MTDEVAKADSGVAFLNDVLVKLKEQNRDLSIEVTRPVFGKQSCRLKCVSLEGSQGKDGQSIISLSFETLDELITITGEKKAPGMTYRNQFGYTIDSPRDEDKNRLEMDIKTLYYLLVSAGIMKRTSSVNANEVISNLGDIVGKEVIGNFDVRDGKTYDDDGNLRKFQTLSFRSVEQSQGGKDDDNY